MQAKLWLVKKDRRGPGGLQKGGGQADEAESAVRELIREKRIIGILLTPFQLNQIWVSGYRTEFESSKNAAARRTTSRIWL